MSAGTGSVPGMPFAQQVADYQAALAWVSRLMSTTNSADFEGLTPCAEFTVRDLMGHLLATAHRGLGAARGESTRHVPHVITDVPDEDLAPTHASLAGQIGQAWRAVAGPAQSVLAPWGECSADQAAKGFTIETLVHGWDLATATGRDPEELSAVAVRCLAFADVVVPERMRGVMYAPPIPPMADDGPATRLARHLGRR